MRLPAGMRAQLADMAARHGKSMTAEVPEKHGMFRVLVGPIPENGINKMRADLQAASFPGNAAIKRTF